MLNQKFRGHFPPGSWGLPSWVVPIDLFTFVDECPRRSSGWLPVGCQLISRYAFSRYSVLILDPFEGSIDKERSSRLLAWLRSHHSAPAWVAIVTTSRARPV